MVHRLASFIAFPLIASLTAMVPSAQGQDAQGGFQRITGKYVDVISDMPLTDELRELPAVFDAAVPQWCAMFGMQLSEVRDWHVEACIMLERQRFIDAQLLPRQIADFPYGFQLGDRVWVTEQPSSYYRRHLLLHEGTHWFMTRKYGRQGPPWLMEGVAEWLGTHRWDGVNLSMGIIPEDKNEVPYWGRISLIQQQLAEGLAPSLETVLRYGDTAHRQVEAYAWSWAAVVFLKHHPQTRQTFAEMLERPTRTGDSTRWLLKELQPRWPELRQLWNATLTELEYGYDPQRGMLTFSQAVQPLQQPIQLAVRADRSWQASGIKVQAQQQLSITAEGAYWVGKLPRPWECHPDGVTLEYYRGQPLGKLLLSVVEPQSQETGFASPLLTVPVGSGGMFQSPHAGELFFRVNESNGGLSDNSGQITITVYP